MRATLLHNPGAGVNQPSKEDLINALTKAGYDTIYKSTKEKPVAWEELKNISDIIVVAGGDGTVGKISKKLVGLKVPVALLPTGTANNIATSLGMKEPFHKLIPHWELSNKIRLSVGEAKGVWGKKSFIESIGFGLFSQLLEEVYSQENKEKGEPQEEIKQAVEHLLKIISYYQPKSYQITIDGKDFSGEYLMVEVMNIKCIGPNLMLAPEANHSDDVFEVVMIGENEIEEFVRYLHNILEFGKGNLSVPSYKGKEIKIVCPQSMTHIDDDIFPETQGKDIFISLGSNYLEFLKANNK